MGNYAPHILKNNIVPLRDFAIMSISFATNIINSGVFVFVLHDGL